jgi:hypothetical protein
MKCLASSYHQETWDMKWNLRTLVLALRGHMLTQPREIGSVLTTPERRKDLAYLSRDYVCKYCGTSHRELLGELPMSNKLSGRILSNKPSLISRKSRFKKNNLPNTRLNMYGATKGLIFLFIPMLIFIWFHNHV